MPGGLFKETSTTQQNSISFDEIRHNLDYEALLTDLGIDGNMYRGEIWCSCPLPDGNHARGDRSASFSVNVTDDRKIGLYNCFACGGGTIIELVAILKNITYKEAEEWVKQFSDGGVILDEEVWRRQIMRNLEQAEEDEEPMPEFDPKELTPYRFVHPWMLKQGMTPEAVKHFQVGYSHERNSVFFPHWWKGKLVGWQERFLTPVDNKRYANTPHFPKRNTVFNLDEVRGDCAIVVEAPKTAIVLWGWGFKNAVATFGASVTPEQVQALWKFRRVYLWFDNDKAGRNALETTTKYMRNVCDVWVVPFVEKEKGDAADLEQHEVQEYLDRAVPLPVWRMKNDD